MFLKLLSLAFFYLKEDEEVHHNSQVFFFPVLYWFFIFVVFFGFGVIWWVPSIFSLFVFVHFP